MDFTEMLDQRTSQSEQRVNPSRYSASLLGQNMRCAARYLRLMATLMIAEPEGNKKVSAFEFRCVSYRRWTRS